MLKPYSLGQQNFLPNNNSTSDSDSQVLKALRVLGVLFLIAFLFPIFEGRKLYLINLYVFFNKGDYIYSILPGSVYLLMLFPLLYGITLLIIPNFLKGKPLAITIFAMAFVPIFFVLVNTSSTSVSFISTPSINIMGAIWLLALSIACIYVGYTNVSDSWKGNIAKYIGLGGGILFMLYLLIPNEIDFKILNTDLPESLMAIEIPFTLFDIKLSFMGIVLLGFFVIMTILSIRLIIVALNKKPLHLNFKSISGKIFIAAWLLYLIGMLIAPMADIANTAGRDISLGTEYYIMYGTTYLKAVQGIFGMMIAPMFYIANLDTEYYAMYGNTYLKAVLYIFPILKVILYIFPMQGLLLLSFSKLFEYFVPEKVGYPQNAGWGSTNYSPQIKNIFQGGMNFNPNNTPAPQYNAYQHQNIYPGYPPLTRSGGGTIYIDTGLHKGAVFVNGVKVGSSGSCQVTGLETGEYRIFFQGENSYSLEESIFLTAGSEPLKFQPAIHHYGKVRLICRYKNPSLFIENLGNIDTSNLIQVPAGKYTIKSYLNFIPETEINIEEGKETVVNLDSKISPVKLEIYTGQYEAEVQIFNHDTDEAHTSKISEKAVVNISPGNISIKATSRGHSTEQKMNLLPGVENNIDLQTRFQKATHLKKQFILYGSIAGGVVILIIVGLLIIPTFGDSSAWSSAQETNTETAYDEYINNYPDGSYVNEAITAKENVVYEDAKKRDSEEGYVNYLTKYPQGRYTLDVMTLMEPKMWSRIKTLGMKNLFDEYIKKYPYGKYLAQAYTKKDSLSKISQSQNFNSSNVYVITGDYIRFRSEPNLLPNTVLPTRFMKGQRLVALEVIPPNGNNGNGFIKVKHNGRIGYISLDFAIVDASNEITEESNQYDEQYSDSEKNSYTSTGSSTDWDAIISEYESYTNRYINLADKINSGDMDALSEGMQIFSIAQKLSNKLSSANNEMTTAQFQRFLRIQETLLQAAKNL